MDIFFNDYKVRQVGQEIWIYCQGSVVVKFKNWKQALQRLLAMEIDTWTEAFWEDGGEVQEIDLMDSGLIENDYGIEAEINWDDFEIGNVKKKD